MITDLKDLTPELIAKMESVSGSEFRVLCEIHGSLIIECMRVALRWRNEMDQMKEERP